MKNTIPLPESTALEIYMAGRYAEQAKYASEEGAKLNTLRGGSAGCHMGKGQVIGKFYNDVARFMGYSLPHGDSTQDIFDLGYSNESVWDGKFEAAGTDFTGDSKYPLKYEIDGVKVSGRPDCIVGTREPLIDHETLFKPEFGIEHKVIASFKVAGKMLKDPKPKDENFVQACHYSYKFNLPWTIVYSQYSIHNPDWWDKKALDEMGYTQIPPFKKEFLIGCDAGNFYWQDTQVGTRVDTRVTATGIQEYYELILETIERKDLTKIKQSMVDIYGNTMYFDPNAYDEIRLTTDMSKGWDHWIEDLERVKELPYVIKRRTIKKKPVWQVHNTQTGSIENFSTHASAYRSTKGNII